MIPKNLLAELRKGDCNYSSLPLLWKMSKTNLRKIVIIYMSKIKPKECQNVEFKRIWKDEYLKWMCGFANAQGTVMYLAWMMTMRYMD